MESIVRIALTLGYSEMPLARCLSKFSPTQLENVADFLTEGCLLPSKELSLLPHQRKIMLALLRGQRGVIAAYPMGSGKTITAIAASECLKRQAKLLGVVVNIYVIVPTSLIGNYKSELEKAGYEWDPEDIITTKTKFFRAIKAGTITSLKNYIVIYDEAHTLRTDYRCEFCGELAMILKGPQPGTVAELSLQVISTAWKVIGLTGTPIYNQPYDWVNLHALATGKPPITAEEYSELRFSDASILQDTFSFYDLPRDDFPRRIDVYHLIEMTPAYFNAYQTLAAKYSKKRKKPRKNSQGEEEPGNAFMVRLRTAMNKVIDARGHKILSPKIAVALDIISKAKRNVVIFSEFIYEGLDVIRKSLSAKGVRWNEIKGSVAAKKRDSIIRDYNAKRINVLIITKAGGEGLNLMETSDIILLESGWTSSMEEQVIARGIRKGSHRRLSESEREVKVHHLLLIYPNSEAIAIKYLGLVKSKLGYSPLNSIHQKSGGKNVNPAKLGPDVYLKWYARTKANANLEEEKLLREYQLKD